MSAGESEGPARLLSIAQLVQLAVYWCGLVSVVNGVTMLVQERMPWLVPVSEVGLMTGLAHVASVAIAVAVQPTVGSISDYTVSRWGRRKPYIIIGTSLDIAFVVGIATSQTLIALAACQALLQLSLNLPRDRSRATCPTSCHPRRWASRAASWGSCRSGAPWAGSSRSRSTPLVCVPGAVLVGGGAGTFLAVDWALITDLVPKAAAGRHMGISNVATETNGLVAGILGGILVDLCYALGYPGAGPRAAYLVAIVSFGLGALLLRHVVKPRERAT